MANARFTVYYYVATNNTLVTEQVGTGHYSTGSSFGVNGLTLSNPTAGGVLTGSVTWTDGNSHAVIWSFTGRRISNFNGTL